MTSESLDVTWNKVAEEVLLGRTIVNVRYLTTHECDELEWSHRPLVLTLDDGTEVVPMQDDEGNDGGSIATNNETGELLPTLPLEAD